MINRIKNLFKGKLPVQEALLDKMIADHLTYLERPALHDVAETVMQIDRDKIPGIIIENGCALGGSSIVISKHKQAARPFFVYDVFGLIPSPGEKDTPDVHDRYKEIVEGKSKGIGGDVYYGYQDDLLQKVKENFRSNGVDVQSSNVHFVQ